MKRYLFSLFFSLSLLMQLQCFSEPHFNEQDSYKIYIQSHQVFVSDEGIYVNLEEDACPVLVNNLFCDAEGLFINAWIQPQRCNHSIVCPHCNGCNPNNNCQWRCKCHKKR